MKKILLTLAAGAAVLAAMPATAAPSVGPGPRPRPPVSSPPFIDASRAIDARRMEIGRRIDMGARRRTLTRREVRDLRYRMNDIAMLERQYLRSNNFMSVQEARVLDRRLDFVEQMLRNSLRDGDRRGGPRRGW
ncbi:hypothetical protein QO010_000132 [Caulobacter ginsengisoli]|uniref:DUF4168 domain-containing protein n=1 Tax=Caulobacter ginsengisoli TaxID=400775 RepID=A0ABU0IK54_9CAUL|nr:hypothetical protein [Caulobacter ginsengisoli]MDQ0462384.1 hypothetical protein [Caulobacter ginsengisoli]